MNWFKKAKKRAEIEFEYYVAANECGDPESWLLAPSELYYGYTRADREFYECYFSDYGKNPILKFLTLKYFNKLVNRYERKR